MLGGVADVHEPTPDQGDSTVAGAAQSNGRSAVNRRIILTHPLLSISIRCRLGVWDMDVGND